MDPNLVVRAQQGDQQAFETLAGAIHPRLYNAALAVLQDAHTAEDATQQALIGIWRYLPRLRDPLKFDGWSYRLVVRACYAEAKRRPDWLPDTAVSPKHEPVASDDFLDVVRRDQLERAFPRLSVEQKAVIVLRYKLDLPLEQVADALDVPVGTVAARLNRALKALRAALDADARPATPTSEEGAVAR
jgi:RNA polymerase sigma-70 factor (ECF subfamily)